MLPRRLLHVVGKLLKQSKELTFYRYISKQLSYYTNHKIPTILAHILQNGNYCKKFR
jgi:hypothetical protein